MPIDDGRYPQAVRDAISIWRAGVRAVGGREAVVACANDPDVDEDASWRLRLGEFTIPHDAFDRIFVIGAGKAGSAMARGLEQVLDRAGLLGRVADSWINVPDDIASEPCAFHLHPSRPPGVNLPTEQVLEGTRHIIDIVGRMTPRDLCICLVSGGGSALLAAPAPPVTLDEKRQVAEILQASGADITALNRVRRAMSQVKGGRLARHCGGGHLMSLILSDIMGDPIDLVASGPTVPAKIDRLEALATLERHDPQRTLFGRNVYTVLESVEAEMNAAAAITNVVVGSNAVAVAAAADRANAMGFTCTQEVDVSRDSDARSVGQQLADWLVNAGSKPGAVCLVSGGEPVVSLCRNPGMGGRNQQLIIEAIDHLCSRQDVDFRGHAFAMLSAGTDGEDGTTRAAGAWIDAPTLNMAKRYRADVRDHLARNDAHTLFSRFGNLLETGPTGTNVCDLRVVLVDRADRGA